MLRIHFTDDDLVRIRVAPEPDVMWEIANSVQLLQNREGGPVFDVWRKRVRARVTASDTLREHIGLLSTLYPSCRYFPDFLTPAGAGSDVDAGIDAVLRTPRDRLQSELAELANVRRLPSWVRDFAAARRTVTRRVDRALRGYHHEVMAPHLEHIGDGVEEYRMMLAHALLDGGVEALIGALTPAVRWRPPVLEADYPMTHDVVLAGRGLTLVPSFFCWRNPVSMADPDLPPVLVLPVRHQPGWLAPVRMPGRWPDRRLAALLGPTRAKILAASMLASTTTELSRRAGVSPATASHHTAALRDAGLLTSTRVDNRMMHAITPLGREVAEKCGQ